jgi:hypothetical protein
VNGASRAYASWCCSDWGTSDDVQKRCFVASSPFGTIGCCRWRRRNSLSTRRRRGAKVPATIRSEVVHARPSVPAARRPEGSH